MSNEIIIPAWSIPVAISILVGGSLTMFKFLFGREVKRMDGAVEMVNNLPKKEDILTINIHNDICKNNLKEVKQFFDEKMEDVKSHFDLKIENVVMKELREINGKKQ